MPKLIRVEVWPHYVLIEGQRVNRPRYIGVAAWMAYWEHRQ